jgi:hypothetical protein
MQQSFTYLPNIKFEKSDDFVYKARFIPGRNKLGKKNYHKPALTSKSSQFENLLGVI